MDNRVNREYRRNESEVLYIYDRVCPKNVKKRQINRAYQPNQTRQSPPNNSGGRPFGSEFAAQQRMRARLNPYKRSSSRAYQYRPGQVGGGEAVKERPLKMLIDRLINLFETIEERGKRDEAVAKQRAVAWKKFSEYRRIILTAILLIAITAAFILLVYELFFVISDVNVNGSEIYTNDELIASTGFDIGDNLYSFTSTEAENTMTFLCPYIKSAEVDRTIPKYVAITVEDDTAVYYATIWGDCVKLSSGLRVLEVVDEEMVKNEELIELILPPVKYSVAGRVLEFSDTRHERFIRSVLSEVAQSSLADAGMVDAVDLSDEYDITLVSGGRYLLRLGSEADCDLKLRMAYKTMTSSTFDTLLPARIDLFEVGKAIIKPDATLTFD